MVPTNKTSNSEAGRIFSRQRRPHTPTLILVGHTVHLISADCALSRPPVPPQPRAAEARHLFPRRGADPTATVLLGRNAAAATCCRWRLRCTQGSSKTRWTAASRGTRSCSAAAIYYGVDVCGRPELGNGGAVAIRLAERHVLPDLRRGRRARGRRAGSVPQEPLTGREPST